MNEEEKEAIETIRFLKDLKWYTHAFDNGTEVLTEEEKQDIDIVLNLIKKQQKELEKKDKIIDKLLMEITTVNTGRYEYMDNDRVLEIFTNLVEKEDK